jgi:hypothetical protein
MTTPAAPSPDADERKGAVEQDSREQETNTTLSGQMQHRNKSPLADTLDTDFPEPGMNPEHTGEPEGHDEQGSRQLNPNPQRETREQPERERDRPASEVNPEAEQQDPDPGQRQKRNQGDKKDDPLAA